MLIEGNVAALFIVSLFRMPRADISLVPGVQGAAK